MKKEIDFEKIYQSLINEDGYTEEEARGVIEGMKDYEEGRTFSAEEVYYELVVKDKAYA